NTEGLARLAQQLHARNDDEGAADFYTRAIQRAPKDTAIRKAFAEILEGHGDYVEADAQYDEALKIKPDDSELLRADGRVLIKLGKPAEAKDRYEHALREDSGDIKALNGLGVSLDYLGNHDAAQTIYRQALDENPDDTSTLTNLAHSYVLSGAWSDAIGLLEPHMNDKDATPALRQNLAEAYGMAGMDVDAERVGRMDLSAEQVKHNLAYYRAHRTHLTPTAGLYADLGAYPTDAMAAAHAEDIQQRFSEEMTGLVLLEAPQVEAIGGTPTFTVHVAGFTKKPRLRAFCDQLKRQNVSCIPHGI
ncbi:MAG: tetratricopeptide repeat protein, partial [Pseudomonadota bacterium]|nr:tetratricopeptide repeat protein [Pseudomonadota bacterium]